MNELAGGARGLSLGAARARKNARRDGVLDEPVVDARRLAVGVFGVEEAEQDDGAEAKAGEDAQIEVKWVEGRSHDLRVGGDEGKALLFLRAKEAEVKVDVGLLSDALEKS